MPCVRIRTSLCLFCFKWLSCCVRMNDRFFFRNGFCCSLETPCSVFVILFCVGWSKFCLSNLPTVLRVGLARLPGGRCWNCFCFLLIRGPVNMFYDILHVSSLWDASSRAKSRARKYCVWFARRLCVYCLLSLLQCVRRIQHALMRGVFVSPARALQKSYLLSNIFCFGWAR